MGEKRKKKVSQTKLGLKQKLNKIKIDPEELDSLSNNASHRMSKHIGNIEKALDK